MLFYHFKNPRTHLLKNKKILQEIPKSDKRLSENFRTIPNNPQTRSRKSRNIRQNPIIQNVLRNFSNLRTYFPEEYVLIAIKSLVNVPNLKH